MSNFWWTDIPLRNFLKLFFKSMLIFGQKSYFLGPTILEIPQPNWYYNVNVICLTVCHQTCLLPRLFMTNFALTSEFWIAILLLQLQSSFKQNRFNNVLLDNNRLGEIDRKTCLMSVMDISIIEYEGSSQLSNLL